MKRGLGKFVLPVLALGMLVFAMFHVVRAQQTLPKPPPPVEPPRTPFGKTVAGAGLVEARTENIAVGASIPGVVLEVYVPVDKVGLRATARTPLFRVDDRQLKAQVQYQEASLLAAQAQLSKLEKQPRPEEVPPSEAKVATARAALAVQQDLADRARTMIGTRSISQEDLNQRHLAAAVARQQLTQAEAELKLLKAGAWEPDKAIARAAIAQAKAQIEQTKTDIERAL